MTGGVGDCLQVRQGRSASHNSLAMTDGWGFLESTSRTMCFAQFARNDRRFLHAVEPGVRNDSIKKVRQRRTLQFYSQLSALQFYSQLSALRIPAGVALAAALFVNHGGDAALGAEVADLHR